MPVTIISGISGSGKSTWVQNHIIDTVICSADLFWGPEYKFDITRIKEAHDWCLEQFMRALVQLDKEKNIVVDNTNLRALEIAPYYRMAEVLGWEVKIVRLLCDPEVTKRRTTHGVPPEKVDAMAKAMGELWPDWKVQFVVVT